MNEFVLSILEDRMPLVDVAQALNMTVAGIVAHQSALKGVELSTKFQNKLKGLITRPEGKPTLVPEDDKRPALTTQSDKFDNLDII